MLEQILSHLIKSGFSAQLIPPSEELSFSQILLNVKNNVIEIRDFPNKLPSESSPMGGSETNFIHFFCPFSYPVPNTAYSEAARLVALINKVSPIPGFGLSEADNLMTFHYVYPIQNLEKVSLDAVIHFILYSIETYETSLKEVAEGKSIEQMVQ